MSKLREMPDGSQTADENKYFKAWDKAGKYLAKQLGFRLRGSYAHLTFEETYDRSNGRDAVSAVHTMEYDVAAPLFRALTTKDFQVKELKDTIKEFETFEVEDGETEVAEEAAVK